VRNNQDVIFKVGTEGIDQMLSMDPPSLRFEHLPAPPALMREALLCCASQQGQTTNNWQQPIREFGWGVLKSGQQARVAESGARCDVSEGDGRLLTMSTHVLVAIDATERQLHIRRQYAVEILLLSQADQLVVGELKDF